jgi:hypothetical protein
VVQRHNGPPAPEQQPHESHDRPHLERRELDEALILPAHQARVQSPEHKAVRRELILTRRVGCYICGRTIDDFGKRSSALEVHHLFVEYAAYNDADPAGVRADHPVFAPYNSEGAYDGVDAKLGSLVLCSLHYRGSKLARRCLAEGIHNADFGTWLMQKYVLSERMHLYFPGVVLIRKGVSDAQGYLPSFLGGHPELAAVAPRRVKAPKAPAASH